MRPQTTLRPLLAAALLLPLVAGPARAEEETEEVETHALPVPDEGDLVNGAKLFRFHCAACHGDGGAGDGTLAAKFDRKLPPLRQPEAFWSKPDADLVKWLQLGVPASQTGGVAIHARAYSELEARDLLAFLRAPMPRLRDFFAGASEFIAHEQTIDGDGQDRAKKALGRPITTEERTRTIYVAYKPAAGRASGRAQRLAEDPRSLYEAVPKRKLGYVGFVPLDLDGGTVTVALALDKGMRIASVRTLPAADPKMEAGRAKLQALLDTFEGAGGREEKKPIEPQEPKVKAGKDVLREMLKAYTLVLEGTAMFTKEERDRFAFDPDAFKQEIEDMPDDVKFDFKEKKK